MTVRFSRHSRLVAGVLLLSIVGIEYGGYFLLTVVTHGSPATPFQESFFRAGHAHAGVLVTLALVLLLIADAAGLRGIVGVLAREGVPVAAILMSAGFFLSALGAGATGPNGFVALLAVGAVSLAVGVVTLGCALLFSRRTDQDRNAPADRS